jgi:ectoine hydroxylase-related dioxygenase (phytanoyl-CoA dioxygenase family)
MEEMFVDKSRQLFFNENGYVLLKGVVSKDVLSALEDVFNKHYGEAGVDREFYTTHWSPNEEYRRKISNEVNNLVWPVVSDVLNNYKAIFGYYLAKFPSQNSTVTLHQDWALVDEAKYTSLSAWLPLVDVNRENGCFQVVRGSHRYFNNPRGMGIEMPYNDYIDYIADNCLEDVPMQAGDLLLFDHKLLHASPPNASNKPRIAAGMVLIPEQAEVLHYFYDEQKSGYFKKHLSNDFLLTSYFDKDNPTGLSAYLQSTDGLIEEVKITMPDISKEVFKSYYYGKAFSNI